MSKEPTTEKPSLSPKHEAFAQLCSTGMAAGTAYARIYTNASSATSETKGPLLVRNGQIRARIAVLQAKVEKAFTMTKAEWLESFARGARKSEAGKEYAAMRAHLREIGLAMPGWYAESKVELSAGSCSPETAAAMKLMFGKISDRAKGKKGR